MYQNNPSSNTHGPAQAIIKTIELGWEGMPYEMDANGLLSSAITTIGHNVHTNNPRRLDTVLDEIRPLIYYVAANRVNDLLKGASDDNPIELVNSLGKSIEDPYPHDPIMTKFMTVEPAMLIRQELWTTLKTEHPSRGIVFTELELLANCDLAHKWLMELWTRTEALQRAKKPYAMITIKIVEDLMARAGISLDDWCCSQSLLNFVVDLNLSLESKVSFVQSWKTFFLRMLQDPNNSLGLDALKKSCAAMKKNKATTIKDHPIAWIMLKNALKAEGFDTNFHWHTFPPIEHIWDYRGKAILIFELVLELFIRHGFSRAVLLHHEDFFKVEMRWQKMRIYEHLHKVFEEHRADHKKIQQENALQDIKDRNRIAACFVRHGCRKAYLKAVKTLPICQDEIICAANDTKQIYKCGT